MYILNKLLIFFYKYKLAVQSTVCRPTSICFSVYPKFKFYLYSTCFFSKCFVICLWKRIESPEKLFILYVYLNNYVLVAFENAC